MTEPNPNPPATVPEQPEAKPPLRKEYAGGHCPGGDPRPHRHRQRLQPAQREQEGGATASAMPMRPASPNAQQVTSFETQQQLQAQHDAEERQRQQELAAAMQQLQDDAGRSRTGGQHAAPMTAAQRDTIYGDSPNAPASTPRMSRRRRPRPNKGACAREKQKQDAINSGTVAIDFEHTTSAPVPAATTVPPQTAAVLGEREEAPLSVATESAGAPNLPRAANAEAASAQQPKAATKTDPMAPYEFDQYQGRLYRIFEGTVLEGVVTNHIDGGFSGPILVMLTTDYYSHDHQQLSMPQGTRLIGTVQSVGNAQQRKMFVTFHRAVCPDGFSLDFDKYIGLDPIGTTGLATKVDHGYLHGLRCGRGHRRSWAASRRSATTAASSILRHRFATVSPSRPQRKASRC